MDASSWYHILFLSIANVFANNIVFFSSWWSVDASFGWQSSIALCIVRNKDHANILVYAHYNW